MPFVKLDTGILDSTLWLERECREIFITALLMAEPIECLEPIEQIATHDTVKTGYSVPPGWYGMVRAAGPGIIRRALVASDVGLLALEKLASPDPGSRSPEFEGRRMIRVDGGFLILNFVKYREQDNTARERSRRWRERQKQRAAEANERNAVATRNHAVTARDSTPREVEVEAEAGKALKAKPTVAQSATGGRAGREREQRAIAHRILTYLNERTGGRFRPGKVNVGLIVARLEYDEATEDLMRQVIDAKVAETRAGEFKAKFLRPATLFGAEKWAQYSGQVGMSEALPAAAQAKATVVSVYGLNGSSSLPVSLFSSNVPFAPDKIDALTIAKRVWENNRRAIDAKFPKEPPTSLVIEWAGKRATFKISELS